MINAGTIKAMDFSGPLYIRYNLFYGVKGDLVRGILYDGCARTILKYNSFMNLNPDENKVRYFKELDITENYWGTTDTTIIDSIIVDRSDYISIPGYVDYLPILTEPHPDTPRLDKTAPAIETPSRIPENDAEPDQEVKVSVNVIDFFSAYASCAA